MNPRRVHFILELKTTNQTNKQKQKTKQTNKTNQQQQQPTSKRSINIHTFVIKHRPPSQYTHTHTHARTHARTHAARTHARTHAHIYTHTHTHTFTWCRHETVGSVRNKRVKGIRDRRGKRWVFSYDFKEYKVWAWGTENGRLFQTEGPIQEKARCPWH